MVNCSLEAANEIEQLMEECSTTAFRAELIAAIKEFGLAPLTSAQHDRLAEHYALLCAWNRRVNLTRVVAPREAARVHYAESLCGLSYVGSARKVLDVGSGAGFPAVPFAVVRSDLIVTALERGKKKAVFLKEAKSRLGLTNFEVIPARLEDFDWSSQDLVVSRALDRAEKVIPSIVSAMKPRQRLLYYCTADFVLLMAARRCTVESSSAPGTGSRVLALFTPTQSSTGASS